MPIIDLPGSFLGHAGIAAAGAMQGEERFRGQLAQVLLRKKAYEQRNAEAELENAENRESERAESLASAQRGMSQALNLGRELGVQTDLAGYQSLDAELRQLDPDGGMHSQLNELYPMVSDPSDPNYAPGFIARSKAVQNLREERAMEGNEAQLGELVRSAETAGYTESELADLESRLDDTPAAFRSRVTDVKRDASDRRFEQLEIERGISAARKLAPDLGPYLDDPATRKLFLDLEQGTSKNPGRAIKELEMVANGHQSVVDEIKAEALQEGQAIERHRSMRAAAQEAELRQRFSPEAINAADQHVQMQGHGAEGQARYESDRERFMSNYDAGVRPRAKPGAKPARKLGQLTYEDDAEVIDAMFETVDPGFAAFLQEQGVSPTDEEAVRAAAEAFIRQQRKRQSELKATESLPARQQHRSQYFRG